MIFVLAMRPCLRYRGGLSEGSSVFSVNLSYKPTFCGKLFTVVGLNGKLLAKAKTVNSDLDYM